MNKRCQTLHSRPTPSNAGTKHLAEADAIAVRGATVELPHAALVYRLRLMVQALD